MQLEPLEQLAVDAFVTALETCQEEGVELLKYRHQIRCNPLFIATHFPIQLHLKLRSHSPNKSKPSG